MSLARDEIVDLFGRLRRADVLPAPRTLSDLLQSKFARGHPVRLTAEEAALFMTAAVEVWQRAVHSFVLSVALTRVSYVWSSVSGYYASHYAVRAIGHLHGFFSLFHRRAFLEMTVGGGHFAFSEPAGLSRNRRGEHQFYWTVVRRLPGFSGNAIFPENDDQTGSADAGHRNHANYSDHLNKFTVITGVAIEELRDRIETVATAALEGAPSVPDRSRYPDLTNVMAMAYLRIYRFREYLDDTVPTRNPFWRSAREATWFTNVMRFPPRPAEGVRAG